MNHHDMVDEANSIKLRKLRKAYIFIRMKTKITTYYFFFTLLTLHLQHPLEDGRLNSYGAFKVALLY